jgi:tetratricopeptide (TPR) repeat protein
MRIKIFVFFFIAGLFVTSCDFTPPLNKEILQAQKYIIQQDYDTAIKKYKDILRKNPPNEIKVKINFQLGDLYSIYLSKNKEALPYYRVIMKISNEPLWLVRTQERMGEIYFSYIKDFRKSEEIYRKLSQFQPRLSKQDFYSFRYAISTFNNGQYKKALSLFTEIKNTKGHEFQVRAIYFEGLIYFQEKKWNKAVDTWKKYLKREVRRDNVVQTKFLMANAYETMEKLKVAYNLYYSILGEYPNTEVVKNRLKAIYERRVARKR